MSKTTAIPSDLTVSQYSCLEQLHQHPGLSNAELARGPFVSRQSTNLVLRGLPQLGLLHRPDTVHEGRARPTALTREGTALLREAGRAARAVEQRMVAPLTPTACRQLVEALTVCAPAVAEGRTYAQLNGCAMIGLCRLQTRPP